MNNQLVINEFIIKSLNKGLSKLEYKDIESLVHPAFILQFPLNYRICIYCNTVNTHKNEECINCGKYANWKYLSSENFKMIKEVIKHVEHEYFKYSKTILMITKPIRIEDYPSNVYTAYLILKETK